MDAYSSAACSARWRGRIDELDVQAQSLKLLDEHVEALGKAWLEVVLALDDRLVHPRAALHVVALHREELLERVSGAVRLHGPDFHFAEALPAELRLAAERLLRDERVRPDRARVDLVVDQVVKLEHVHHAHRHFLIEGLTRAAVEENRLSAGRQAREPERILDLPLLRAVEDGARVVDAAPQLDGELTHVVLAELRQQLRDVFVTVEDLLDVIAHRARAELLLEHVRGAGPRARARPNRGGSRGSARRSYGSERRAD